jgi:hypothetical protein
MPSGFWIMLLTIRRSPEGAATASVPIPKFVILCGTLQTDFGIDQDTRVMIETFAIRGSKIASECLDLNHTSKSMIPRVLYDSEVRSGSRCELWRTSDRGHEQANVSSVVFGFEVRF